MQRQDTTKKKWEDTRYNFLRLAGSQLSFKLYWIVHGKITASDKYAVMLWPRLSHFRSNKNEQCMNECVDNFCRISKCASIASLTFFLVIYFGKYQIQWNRALLDLKGERQTNTHHSHQRPHACTKQCQNRSFIVQRVLSFCIFISLVGMTTVALVSNCVRCELP